LEDLFPEDLSDWRGQLKALADAEACAIGVYNAMIQKLSHCYKKKFENLM
jgi:ferritin-like protein